MAKPPGRTPAAGPQPTVRGRKAETRAANEACRLLRTSPHARGAGPGAVQTPRSVPPKPPRPRRPVGRWQAGGGGSPPPPGARPVWPPGKPLGGGLGPGTHASSPPGSPLPTETCRSQGHAHGGRSGARTWGPVRGPRGAGQGRAWGPNRVREEDAREASVPREPTASRRPGRPCPASATPSSSRTSLGPKVWALGQGALGVWAPGWGLQESGLRGGRSGGLPTRPRTGVGVCPRKLLKTLTGREHAVQPPPPALSPLNTHPPPAHAPANRNLHHLPAL